MQALTPTILPCYSPADRAVAAAIAAFVERGTDARVFLDEGALSPGEDLAAKAREARMADMAIVLFSRQSMPPRWPRAAWEDALVTEPAADGFRIAFARLDDCAPPPVLKPRFELGGLRTQGLRALKRWVRDPAAPPAAAHSADLEVLGIALADRPGMETVAAAATAREFARLFRQDFDAVLSLEDCSNRTLTALAGDLGSQLGLRLEGDLESNLARLRGFCLPRRLLIVLEGAAPRALVFGGRCSTLASVEAGDARALDEFACAQRAFRSAADWCDVSAAARQGRRLAHEQGRLAEGYELMEEWHAEAEEYSDRAAMDESAREMVWILQTWGRGELAERLDFRRAAACDEQMPLPFE
ncbi:MAG TPA: TIR domain-containing protein [Bryobacteraceae bacterium]|nr:TIR domain-containing protein [Bryobacteraceae bacterium]